MSLNKGLNPAQIQDRIIAGKVNIAKHLGGRSYTDILVENIFNFVNIILFVIGALLAIAQRLSDALVYVGVVLLNAVIGTVQEIRAKIQLDRISLLTKPLATVIRDGREQKIKLSGIVMDDILVLNAGDLIPVDARVIEGSAQADESLLTGESDSITKSLESELSSGSYIISGTVLAMVTKVGTQTLAYQITSGVKTYKKNLTPLQKEINLSIRILVVISLLFTSLVVINTIFNKVPFTDSLPITAVIAGIIPSSLFVMISLAYAIGSIVLLRNGALVQQPNAVESLSSVDILCTDKTGTLTTNKIILEKIYPLGENSDDYKVMLANFISNVKATTPTLEALAGLKNDSKLSLVEEVAFSSEYKWSGFSFKQKDTQGTYILGAPEVLFSAEVLAKESFYKKILSESDKGLRVLLFVSSSKVLELTKDNKPSLPTDLKPTAIITFKNELRTDVKNTLSEFTKAGVEIKIISGDNTSTVYALAKQAGIFEEDVKIISGSELSRFENNPGKIAKIVAETSIFGRITPKQKKMIVESLKSLNKHIAMIGDGVNDALSIKEADLGIAMESGSQVTRNTSDILLLNDSFSSLPKGLLEGQKIRNAIESVFNIYFTRVLYLLLMIVAISLVGIPFPFTIKQNALISVLTTGLPSIWLTAFSNYGKSEKKRLTLSSLGFVIPAGLTLAIFGVILYVGYGYFKYSEFVSANISMVHPEFVTRVILRFLPNMRTMLASFLIVSGLILSIFVSAPNQLLSLSKRTTGNWKPTILAVASLVSFFILLLSHEFRSFWDLSRLSLEEILVVFLVSILWAVSLKIIYKHQLLYKLVGYTPEAEDNPVEAD